MSEISRIEVKQVLRRSNIVDHYFGNRYSFSPYRACTHACIYCDGRAEKYYVDGDFASSIVVRKNLIERLEKELPRLRERGIIMGGSGVTDAYQPVEAEEKLMAGAADVLYRKGFPVMVITKSVLIGRDLELWKKMNENAGFILLLTLCTLSEPEREIFEPGAPPVQERLGLINEFKDAGIPVGITAMPLLPLLWDSPRRLESLFGELGNRVDYILPASLTLRPGIQKETYLKAIKDNFPNLLPEYERLYGENRPSGAPLFSYQKKVYHRIFRLMTEMEIPFQMPHRLYRERISLADEIHILLRHLEELYRPRGIDTRPVRQAEKRYTAWISPLRKEYNRRRSLPPGWMDEKLIIRASENKLGELLDNEKLGGFLSEIIMENTEFDYISLKLKSSTPRKKRDLLL